MFYLEPDLETPEVSLVLRPSQKSRNEILKFVNQDAVLARYVAAFLMNSDGYSKVKNPGLKQAIDDTAVDYQRLTGTIRDIGELTFEGKFVAQVASLDLPKGQGLIDDLTEHLAEADMGVDYSDKIALLIPLTFSQDNTAVNKDLIGTQVSFTQLGAITRRSEVYKVTMDSEIATSEKSTFIISRNEQYRCNGFAVVRRINNELLACFEDRTSADVYVRELEKDEADQGLSI